MPYKLAQLTVNPERKSEILSRVFVSQPSMEEEQILGKLFVLVEINNHKTNIALANFLIDRINLFYYQNEQVPLLARLATVTIGDIFENSLAKLNQDIVSFTQAEKISFNPHDFHITIGVIFKNKLFFSSLGKNKAVLIYKSKIKNNRQVNNYNLINITASTADPTQEIIVANKLFTNTVVGSIPPASYAVFTNESLYEFLSEKQLIKIITTLPPAGAAQQIQNIVGQTNVYMPFIALIIQNQQFAKHNMDWQTNIVDPRVKAEPSPIHHAMEPSRRREKDFRQERDINKESIKAFNRTAEKTAQILRPPGFVNAEKIKKLLSTIKLPVLTAQRNKLIINRGNLAWLKRESLLSFKKLQTGLSNFLGLIIGLSEKLWQLIRDRRQRQQLAQQMTVFKGRFNKKHIAILTAGGLCLIVLIVNILYGYGQKNKKERDAVWQTAKEQFYQKEKQITADLLYDNKNKAQINLEEMSTIIEHLKDLDAGKHQEELLTIEATYQDLIDRTSGLTRISDPQKIWSLPDNQLGDNLGLVDDRLYVGGDQGIWSLSLHNQQADIILGPDNNPRLLNHDRDGNIFFLTDNELIRLNAKQQINRQNIAQTTTINIAAVYNNRLYTFNQSDKQIYRHQLTGGAVSSPDAWLKESLTDHIADLAIDTSIYLLTDQNILKYDSGSRQTLKLDAVFPPIVQAKKISAPAATDILGLIDPPTKRLIIFSRSGKLLSHHSSEAWDNLRGLAIDTKGQAAYILNGGDVYKVNLQ